LPDKRFVESFNSVHYEMERGVKGEGKKKEKEKGEMI
jgi:hypothetical protein